MMSRPFYTEVPGGTFHVTSRGIAKRTVFEDERDNRSFLLELSRTVRRHGWRCLSYCLMVNHFHLILQTPEGNLADGMRDLKSNYARTFRARRGSDGSLFKARYWRQLIQEDGYLLAAAIYVAQNPVRAGLVERPGDWPWSSYNALAYGGPGIVHSEPLLELLAPEPERARSAFRELAGAGSDEGAFDPSLPIVGDERFILDHAPERRPERDVAKRAWEQARPSLTELASLPLADFVHRARVTHCYTLAEIAEHLQCSDQTVRRLLRVSGVGTRLL